MSADFPEIPFLRGWDAGRKLVLDECQQSLEEGKDCILVGSIQKRAEALDPSDHQGAFLLWREVSQLPVLEDFPYHEPNNLAEIHAARGPGWRSALLPYGDEELLQRLHGAWLGRSIGCALGRPVECFSYGNIPQMNGRQRIKAFLSALPGEYPLCDYFPSASPADHETGKPECPGSRRDGIRFMESDDDIIYTVLGQLVMRNAGSSFTTRDVAAAWMDHLSYNFVCTAETQAYRNLVIRYRIPGWVDEPVDWNWVATHQNPYREWIGAQIRADSWGYAAPGNPEQAAEFAWRDARMTHVKNGIYGEMFVAAMIAAGFVLSNPLEVVQAGLAEIPARSRLHADIIHTLEICRRHRFDFARFEAVLDDLYEAFGHYHWVHTNNNAALVVAALLLGGGDFEKTVTLAVMGGWDTDCNGATVGSIWGTIHGVERIPDKWKKPLNDTLCSAVIDYHPIAISECARRSLEIVQKNRNAAN
ncbi:MAG: ADP-ribosylglycohydrolase family protein [Candidatus Methylacidiphilales bacterium]|nr:ADP-ribosylglycohydrolase family protein [Candidatus Methylacidiphilales bacterium]